MPRFMTTIGLAMLATGVVLSAESAQDKSSPSGPARTGQTQHSSVSGSADEKFVKEAAMGGMAEVDLGMLASAKGSSEEVKVFGQQMVTDHGAAGEELKSLAAGKQIALQPALDSKHQATHDRLAKLTGSAFDRAYVADMLKDHQTDVSEFRREASSGKDAEVKAWASKTLPTLQEHLKRIQELDKRVTTTRSTR